MVTLTKIRWRKVMPITPERLKRLQELGLTEYQAKTYLALLDVGEATASQLPHISRVPRTRIYTTMNQLHEKGLVEIKPETPMKYRALPIERYVERHIAKIREEATRLDSVKAYLARDFQIKTEEAPPKPGRFRVFYGRRNMMEELERMYDSATKEVLHLGTPNTPGRVLKALHEAGRRLKERGVSLKIALPIDLHNRADVDALQEFAEVRHMDRRSVMPIVIVDSDQALIADIVKDDKNVSLGDSLALWTNDKMIVRGLGEVVRDMWSSGIEVDRFDPEKISVHNLMKWLLTMELKSQGFVDQMVEQIGKQISSELRGGDLDQLLKDIAAYWEANGLGKVRAINKEPLEIVIDNSIDCATMPDMGNPLCRITEGVLKRIFDEKLNVDSRVVEDECHGLGHDHCAFKITIAAKENAKA